MMSEGKIILSSLKDQDRITVNAETEKNINELLTHIPTKNIMVLNKIITDRKSKPH